MSTPWHESLGGSSRRSLRRAGRKPRAASCRRGGRRTRRPSDPPPPHPTLARPFTKNSALFLNIQNSSLRIYLLRFQISTSSTNFCPAIHCNLLYIVTSLLLCAIFTEDTFSHLLLITHSQHIEFLWRKLAPVVFSSLFPLFSS